MSRIILRGGTFHQWKKAKMLYGYSKYSHSDFAAFLLCEVSKKNEDNAGEIVLIEASESKTVEEEEVNVVDVTCGSDDAVKTIKNSTTPYATVIVTAARAAAVVSVSSTTTTMNPLIAFLIVILTILMLNQNVMFKGILFSFSFTVLTKTTNPFLHF